MCLISQTCVLGWSNRVIAKKDYFPRTYRNLHFKHIKDNQLYTSAQYRSTKRRGKDSLINIFKRRDVK